MAKQNRQVDPAILARVQTEGFRPEVVQIVAEQLTAILSGTRDAALIMYVDRAVAAGRSNEASYIFSVAFGIEYTHAVNGTTRYFRGTDGAQASLRYRDLDAARVNLGDAPGANRPEDQGLPPFAFVTPEEILSDHLDDDLVGYTEAGDESGDESDSESY